MNKKLLYGLLGVGAIAGFYFFNKNKKPVTNVVTEQQTKPIPDSVKYSEPVMASSTLNKKKYPQKTNNVKQNIIKTKGSKYDDAIIPKGTIIEDVRIISNPLFTSGTFNVNKINDFDGGSGYVKSYEFDIIEVKDTSFREKVDKVLSPYAVDYISEQNGFKIGTGDIVKIRLNQDIKRTFPNQIIIFN
jgi:hypothetical protein